MANHHFLSRWSRKKAGLTEETAPTQTTPPIQDASAPAHTPEKQVNEPSLEQAQQESPPPPTLEDVEKMDVKSPDFSAFMRSDVDPVVQQAALKKMFSDPHFNVMDGLDIYIDDYTKSDPIPLDMLKRMRQSDLLGLFKSAEELYPESKETNFEQTSEAKASSEEGLHLGKSEENKLTHTNQSKSSDITQKSAAQPMDIESEPISSKTFENKSSGETGKT